ncbi:MAG: ABC transporter ATP-binding protein [Lachnospiraceae bacterium]|nr:ABC transporter ATP-binding protein [Lachnospiraceae bacterium]
MLTVKDLKIEFFDHELPEVAVKDVDFTINDGEILGIVGESGSGKSMTAMAIAGLLNRKDLTKSGSIDLDGVDLLNSSRKEIRAIQGNEIGFVFQDPLNSMNPVLKVGPQVEEAMRIRKKSLGLSKEDMKARALELMKSVGLEDAERIYDSYPHQISGGQRQRAMIAAALVLKPKLLICDEPTTALDVTVQKKIIDVLKELNRETGTSILFISHDLSVIKALCDKVVVMKDGLVVEEGSVKEIFENPKNDYTRQLIF